MLFASTLGLFFRLSTTRAMAAAPTTTASPIPRPIPAFAAVLRPEEVGFGAGAALGVVLAVEVVIEVANGLAVELTVEFCVELAVG